MTQAEAVELAGLLFAAWVSGYAFGLMIWWFKRIAEHI